MPTPTTVSTCTPEMHHGKHVFEIFGYSEHRGLGSGKFIRSGTFTVGGHDWAIRFYPDGFNHYNSDNISVGLELLNENALVRGSCNLSLVDQTTGLSSLPRKIDLRMMFDSSDERSKLATWISMFRKRSDFEESSYLKDDHLSIECILTVKKARVSTAQFLNQIEPPPSNITEQLGKLLDAEEGADVKFNVGGEIIAAHKIVLAIRSPVFRAELYGPMREAKEELVTIEDMQPDVFRALLHFIYTDSLSGTDHYGGEANSELICHLLVAADRYAVDRLKVVCESILCRNLDVETVSTTLALAYQYNCDKLKDFCLAFASSPNVMDAVMATQGYKNLEKSCPLALTEIFEKTMRFRKI